MNTSTWIAGAALLVSLVGMILNGRKDTRTDAATNAITQTKLDNLINGVTEIRVEMKTIQETVRNHGERLATVEAELKSEKHRIDDIEERI